MEYPYLHLPRMRNGAFFRKAQSGERIHYFILAAHEKEHGQIQLRHELRQRVHASLHREKARRRDPLVHERIGLAASHLGFIVRKIREFNPRRNLQAL